MIRLLLVDDQSIIRQGLRMRLLLEPDIVVVGEASSGEQAIELVHELAPDIVLMDVEMPGMDGITATAALRADTLLIFGIKIVPVLPFLIRNSPQHVPKVLVINDFSKFGIQYGGYDLFLNGEPYRLLTAHVRT